MAHVGPQVVAEISILTISTVAVLKMLAGSLSEILMDAVGKKDLHMA